MNEIIKIGGKEVELKKELFEFNDQTVNDFLQKYAAFYYNYQNYHADSQYIYNMLDAKYDQLYNKKFEEYKIQGGSDKFAEARTRSDPEVQEAVENVCIAKRNFSLLTGYLRSLERAFDAARELCFNLRKQFSGTQFSS